MSVPVGAPASVPQIFFDLFGFPETPQKTVLLFGFLGIVVGAALVLVRLLGPNPSGAPVETAPPNVPENKPAFAGQTRAPGLHSQTKFKVDDLPCRIACDVPRGDGSDGTYNPDQWVDPKEQRRSNLKAA